MALDGTTEVSAMDFSTGPWPNSPRTQFNNVDPGVQAYEVISEKHIFICFNNINFVFVFFL